MHPISFPPRSVSRACSAVLLILLIANMLWTTVSPAQAWPWKKEVPHRVQLKPEELDRTYTPLQPLQVSRTWWDTYQREDLDAFVTSAILNNLELKAKEAELNALQQQVKKQFAQELPTVSLGGSWTRQKNSKTLITPSASQFQGAGPRVFSPGSTFSIYNLPLTVDYEIDLFGKNRFATKAMGFRYQAEILRLRDMELSLAEHATATALQQLSSQALEILAKERLVLQEEMLHLERSRAEGGLENVDPTLMRYQSVESRRDALVQRMRQTAEFQHEASFLVGQSIKGYEWQNPASPDALMYFEGMSLEPFVAWCSIDSNALIQRPDVGVYELLMQASGLDVQVARRMFLPSFRLSAQVGLASTQLSQLFDWDSLLASFGLSLAQQLFAGGALKANLKEQQARYDQVGKQYRHQLLMAGRDVEDAIAALDQTLKSAEVTRLNQLSAQEAYKVEQARYGTGLVSYLNVLQRQEALVNQREAHLMARRDVLLAFNRLQRQLGGGYTVTDAT
jgi:NodT family efflux transporter outer membrane factor (OMF) lipoprotein